MAEFWYLSTPYTGHKDDIQTAYEDACRAAATLIKTGLDVFSPIAHSHPIAEIGGIDGGDHSIWMRVDKPFMERAAGLIVVKMPGWETSKGVQEEIGVFDRAKKPILYMRWPCP